MDNLTERIIRTADDRKSVAEIAEICGCGTGRVYTVLREHRPNRERKRRRTSALRDPIVHLLTQNYHPSRIAKLCGVTRAYVYQIRDQVVTQYVVDSQRSGC